MCSVSEEEASQSEPEVADDIVRSRFSKRTSHAGHVWPDQIFKGAVHVFVGHLRCFHEVRSGSAVEAIRGDRDRTGIPGQMVQYLRVSLPHTHRPGIEFNRSVVAGYLQAPSY